MRQKDANTEQVIQQYADMVYRMEFAKVWLYTEADDIFQEVFLRYLKREPNFESEEHAGR